MKTLPCCSRRVAVRLALGLAGSETAVAQGFGGSGDMKERLSAQGETTTALAEVLTEPQMTKYNEIQQERAARRRRRGDPDGRDGM